MLLNATKCQGYSFFHLSVIKGKPTTGEGEWGGGGGGGLNPATQVRVKTLP